MMKWLRTGLSQELTCFAAVGTVGLVVDATIFMVGLKYFNWGIPWARMLSVICSITTTWALNRRYTFRGSVGSLHWEYARYATVHAAGLVINLGVFALCLLTEVRRHPLIALAAGAAVASAFNFLVARTFAYVRPPRARLK